VDFAGGPYLQNPQKTYLKLNQNFVACSTHNKMFFSYKTENSKIPHQAIQWELRGYKKKPGWPRKKTG